ncbi:hypothetical protein K435DRAFT_781643 [Dendrothele bispora CBS 962.96]|uniref:Uncharacterized protein n=1 Tax=Dendrothele bispora (strain CBS 962.96) TaxID=1314807 RepID=A0A4S8LKG5_DENBC|nr:hypothetical protein K435DRAFT_781643 [Dendrothele bispora CBS 962.96]
MSLLTILDCAREEVCNAVQLAVGKIPSVAQIKCTVSDPSRCGLSLILNWGGGMSVWKLIEWVGNAMITLLAASRITFSRNC